MSTLRLLRAGVQLDDPGTIELAAATAGTASAGLVVQGYTTQVAQQPAIVIPPSLASRLPPINEYLTTAQDNAADYLTNVQPAIIGVITDVGGYATQFDAFFPLITSSIDAWKGGSVTAKADALALLEQLQTDLTAQSDDVAGVQNAISGFQTKLNGDVSNFSTALAQAEIVIGGDTGALSALEREIGTLDEQIGGASAGVALSGLTVVGGALMIAAGSVASFITAGTSTPLVVAGVAVVVVGAGGLTASSIILANLIGTKSGLLQQRAQLNANLKFLADFKSTLGTLNSAAVLAGAQLTSMGNAWTILGGNLNNTVGSVQSAQTYSDLPVVVQAYLNTAGTQWKDVLTGVRTIQSQLTGVQTTVLTGPSGLEPLTLQSLERLAA